MLPAFLIIQSVAIGLHGGTAQTLTAIRYDDLGACANGLARLQVKVGRNAALLRPMFCTETQPSWWVEPS